MDLGDGRWGNVAFVVFLLMMLQNKRVFFCAQLPSEKVQTQFTANSRDPLVVSTNSDLMTSILDVAQGEPLPT